MPILSPKSILANLAATFGRTSTTAQAEKDRIHDARVRAEKSNRRHRADRNRRRMIRASRKANR